MAQQVMKGYSAFLGTYDISPDFSKVSADLSAPSIENTPMNVTDTRTYLGGIPEAKIDFEGYWQEGTGTIGDILNTYRSSDGTQLICYAISGPLTGSGNGGFATQLSSLSVINSEQIGDVARIRFTSKSYYPLINVTPLYGLATRVGPASNNGNVYQLVAIPAGKTLYGFLCVTAVSGSSPTLVVKLQSSATGAGGWSDRITFTSTGVVTTEVKTLAGPITDTYWQQYWTIGGTSSPTFTFTSAWGFK